METIGTSAQDSMTKALPRSRSDWLRSRGACRGRRNCGFGRGYTQRLLSSSFLGLPHRALNMNHKKEVLRSLWVISASVNQAVDMCTCAFA